MEMCPNCGEELPDNSPTCWKCGTELSLPTEPETEGKTDAGKKGAAPPGLELCPYCEAPLPKKALRCRECGRTVKTVEGPGKVETVGWKLGTWGIFLGVAALVVVVVALATWPSAEAERQYVTGDFDTARRQLAAQRNEAEAVFQRDYAGRYVQEWQGTCRSYQGGVLEIECGQEQGRPLKVRVALNDEGQKKASDAGIAASSSVRFSAKLVGYMHEGFVFSLENGTIE